MIDRRQSSGYATGRTSGGKQEKQKDIRNAKRKGIILGEGKRGSIDSLRAVFKGKPTLLLIFPAVLLIRSD